MCKERKKKKRTQGRCSDCRYPAGNGCGNAQHTGPQLCICGHECERVRAVALMVNALSMVRFEAKDYAPLQTEQVKDIFRILPCRDE